MKTTEIYTKGELNAKAEVALMGRVTPVRDKDNIIYMIDYISKVIENNKPYMTGEEIYNKATEFIDAKETMIIGLSVCRVMDMPCLNVIFKDIKDTEFKLNDAGGVLTYVYNYEGPDMSELGYCYFEKQGNTYHRIA